MSFKTCSKQLHEIPLSVLDLSPIVAGGTAGQALRNSLDLAQHAERWGYHRYWVAEHHNMTGIASSATSVLIGYLAGGTSSIRVGSGGIMLPNHAPLVIAEHFGTLESLFPGRIDLGLGRAPGTDHVTAQALRRDLVGRSEDFPRMVEELRNYLTPPLEPSQMKVRAIPGEGLRIPIWLLGSSDYSARLAGQLGLPFGFAGHFSPNYIQPALAVYRDSFRPSGVLEEPYVMVGLQAVVADSDDKAAWLSTSMQQTFLSLVRGRRDPLLPPVETMEGLWTEYEKAALEKQLGTAIIGSPRSVRKLLQDFLDQTQADELILTSHIYDHSERLRSYELLAELSGRKES